MITELQPNEIFVFGSNVQGQHIGGAALYARDNFGAEDDIGEGLTGQCYAFPTLDFDLADPKRDIDSMKKSRDKLYSTARALPEKTFLLTPVGTGIAGFEYWQIEPLFRFLPPNIKKAGWKQ